MSIPIRYIDNNPHTFNQEFLDSVTYLKGKGSSLCLIAKTDNLEDLNNIKRYHVKDPVCFAPVLADGNCAMRAVVLSLLMQGVLNNKQLFTAETLGQIFRENKDHVNEFYGIDSPKDFARFIEEYRALTPEKCAVFFKNFFSKSKDNEIFKFLIACLRLDIFIFCQNNFTAELVNKLETKEFFEENLNELPILRSHVNAEFLHFYLQNHHQISIDVYQVYQGRKESDPWFYSEDNNPRQAQRSQNLHLSIVFSNSHFDVVIFEEDINQYFKRNKDKCLEKQPDFLKEQLINKSSFIHEQHTQITTRQDLTQEKDKLISQPLQGISESINNSKEPSLELFKSDGSECLDNRLNETYSPSNDSVINKQDKQITIRQDLIQEKDKLMNQSSQGVSESINNSKEPSLESFKRDRSERLDNRPNEAYPPSNDLVFNKQDEQIVVSQGLIQEKNKIMDGASENSLNSFESDSESESEYQLLLENSKKIKEIASKQLKKNENQLLTKQLNLLTECLFSHDTTINEIDQQNAFLFLIEELKDELTDRSSRGSLDHLNKKLLNDARLILNKSIDSADQLLEHSKNLKKIFIEHQEKKLNFYFEQKNRKRLLKRLDFVEGYLSKLHTLNQGEDNALYSLRKYLEAEQVSESWHNSLDNLDKELFNQAKLILNRSGESEEQLREDSKALSTIYNEYKEKKLTSSPGLFSNKNDYSCRQQENQKGLNTDLVTGSRYIK